MKLKIGINGFGRIGRHAELKSTTNFKFSCNRGLQSVGCRSPPPFLILKIFKSQKWRNTKCRKKTNTLVVNKKRISVSKEVYMAYYRHKEREDYLDKLSEKYDISF